MNIIPGFVTVRTASTRLPSKCLLPFENGNVLEHIIRRAKYFNIDPIVCTTTDDTDDIVERIAVKEGAKFFRGSVNDKLRRWLDCCYKFNLQSFHSVDADDPFFDGDLMHKSYSLLAQGYDIVYPTESSSIGGASVGYSLTRGIVEKACVISNTEDKEMMWYYIEKVPNLRQIQLPEEHIKPPRVRLTLDYEEDYWLLKTVQRILGSNATRHEVDDLFRKNPDLYLINWFRNQEWKENQLSKYV